MTTAKVIYITSSGHSGSTLLDLLLGSHPKVASLGEVSDLAEYPQDNKHCTCRRLLPDCPLWSGVRRQIADTHNIDIFATPQRFPVALSTKATGLRERLVRYQRLGLALLGQRALTRLEITPPGSVPARRIVENVLTLFDAVCQVADCEAVVDSSKSHVRMKWLWMARPQHLKALYLVRDGRGVMHSYMRKGRTAEQAARMWDWEQALTRLTLRSMPRSAWLFVRYEDLCSDPRGQLSRICRFLSLDFSEPMLSFGDVIHHNIGGNKMRLSGRSEIVNSERWRRELGAAELRLFERIAGRTNQRLGYPPTEPGLLTMAPHNTER